MQLRRRSVLKRGGGAVGGLVGLSGCLGLRREDTTVEAEVINKWLRIVHETTSGPIEEGVLSIAVVGPYGFGPDWSEEDEDITQEMLAQTELVSWVEEETSFGEEDLHPDVQIEDFPMSEIYAAEEDIEFRRTFITVGLNLKSDDDVNGVGSLGLQSYDGPTEFFDRLEPGERYTFRVGEPDGYYPLDSPRIVDILD